MRPQRRIYGVGSVGWDARHHAAATLASSCLHPRSRVGPQDVDTLVEESLRDINIATIGNVDSGKSTLVGVLTKNILDDGRGKARSKVFNFSHEARAETLAHRSTRSLCAWGGGLGSVTALSCTTDSSVAADACKERKRAHLEHVQQ